MKKFTYLLVAMFIAFGASAQVLSFQKSENGMKSKSQRVETVVGYSEYQDGDQLYGLGPGNEAGSTEVMIRLTPEELENYYGTNAITKIIFAMSTTYENVPVAESARVRIYGNGTENTPGEKLCEQELENLNNGWNEVVLSDPLPITSGDYWVGYEVNVSQGFPCLFDLNPTIEGKSAWFYGIVEDGGEAGWHEIPELGIDGNWLIYAVLDDEVAGIETELGHSLNAFGGNGIITINDADAATAQIFNVAGQLVNTVSLSKATTVEVPAGVYVVRVGNAVQKVLVK